MTDQEIKDAVKANGKITKYTLYGGIALAFCTLIADLVSGKDTEILRQAPLAVIVIIVVALFLQYQERSQIIQEAQNNKDREALRATAGDISKAMDKLTDAVNDSCLVTTQMKTVLTTLFGPNGFEPEKESKRRKKKRANIIL